VVTGSYYLSNFSLVAFLRRRVRWNLELGQAPQAQLHTRPHLLVRWRSVVVVVAGSRRCSAVIHEKEGLFLLFEM
jgi:hypothetical protein